MDSNSRTPVLQSSAREKWPQGRTFLVGSIAFAAAFWLLRETYAVTMPTMCALLLALAVWPVARSVRAHMSKPLSWVGAAVALLLVLLILLIFFAGIGLAAQQLYELGSSLAPQLQERVGSLPLPDILTDGPDRGSSHLLSGDVLVSRGLTALNITASIVGGIVVILFLMLLMLTEAHNWHEKIAAIASRGGDRRWLEIGRSVGEKFRAYFTTRLILGALTAALYVGWLAIFGVDYLLLWGVLAVLLNFIPTVGSIVAGTLPVLYVLVTRDLGAAAIMAAGLLVIEQVMGNFVDPKIMGRRLAVSPLVVLVSLLFWSILWGIPGAFLAVPLTVLITMVMAHFRRLEPVALLLTDCSNLEELEQYRQPRSA